MRLIYKHKASKGVSFLGFSIRPTGVSYSALSRRDNKIAQFHSLCASKRRIGLYLARWLGWACIVAPPAAISGICNVLLTTPPACLCSGTVIVSRITATGAVDAVMDSLQCDNAQSSATCNAPTTDNTTGTHYYKNTTEPSSYFKCDWVAGVGYTAGTASTYTPTSPPAPTVIAPSPVRVPFAPIPVMGTLLLLLGIVAEGLRKRWNFGSRRG